MSLFFETSRQSVIFLAFVPFGVLLAMLFSALRRAGRFRALLDVLCLLMSSVAFLCVIVMTKDDGLRLYQLLAVAIGALLYTLGIERALNLTLKKLGSRRQNNASKRSGD